MSVITTGNHPKLLWPGLHKLFGLTYKDLPRMHTEVFDVRSSDKAYEEVQELTGFGLAPVKSEGGAVSYDTHSQGFTTRFTNVNYGLGFIETQEAVDDNLYKGRASSRTKALARSMNVTKETVLANILNRAFDSNYQGGDGKELLATDHPVATGGTQANELSVASDLSEAAIEDMLILIRNAKDSRGLRINLMGKYLLVAPDNEYDATRIVYSTLQNDTANNAINAMKHQGRLPGGVKVWPYLTDADAWFVPTDVPEGMILFNRKSVAFTKDSDFDTDNFKHKATERYIGGWGDWRGMFGSEGA